MKMKPGLLTGTFSVPFETVEEATLWLNFMQAQFNASPPVDFGWITANYDPKAVYDESDAKKFEWKSKDILK